MMIARKVAAAAAAGNIKEGSFEEFWPLPDRLENNTPVPSFAATSKEMISKILASHGIK